MYLQYFFGELPFEQLYDLMRWKFLSSTNNCRTPVVLLYDILKIQHRTVYTLESLYGDQGCQLPMEKNLDINEVDQ